MNLYLNDKERKLYLLKVLESLLVQAYKDPNLELVPISSISKVLGTYDPAFEFVDYYCQEFNVTLDSMTKKYISNSLYAAKGTLEIEGILNNLLFKGVTIHIDMEFPKIKEIKVQGTLATSDPTRFIVNFTNMLYSLLYYTEISYALGEVILKLSTDVNSIKNMQFKFITQHFDPIVTINTESTWGAKLNW